MIQISNAEEMSNARSQAADNAARGALTKIGPLKSRIIRMIEALARPIISILDRSRPPLSPLQEATNILVIEYWNLGDIVMESPFLINLRTQYPQAHIVLLAGPKVVPLIDNQGLVDEIVQVRVPWAEHYSRWRKYNPFSTLWITLFRALRLLRARNFDLAFSARADLRDNLMMRLVNARRRIGYSFGGGGLFLTDRVMPDLRDPHFSNRWLRLLEHLGKPIIERQPRLRLPREDSQDAIKLFRGLGVGPGDFLLGVHAGARSPTRQWGEANFREVAERLLQDFPIKIVWFCEPGSQPAPPAGNRVLCLSLPLDKFVSVLGQCGMLICNDSGPMHIAAALGVPVVAVFGPTEPAWFAPLGSGSQIVIRPGFWCRPCFDYCQFDQPYCLRFISVSDVHKRADQALASILGASSVAEEPVAQEVPPAHTV